MTRLGAASTSSPGRRCRTSRFRRCCRWNGRGCSMRLAQQSARVRPRRPWTGADPDHAVADDVRADVDATRGADDRRAGGAGLGGLPALRADRRGSDLLRTTICLGSGSASGPSRSRWHVRSRRARRRRRGSPGTAPRRSPRSRHTGRRRTGTWSSGGSTSSSPNRFIRLLEKPEYKRRWAAEPWEKRSRSGAAGLAAGPAGGPPVLVRRAGPADAASVAQLADEVTRDADLVGGARAVGGPHRTVGHRVSSATLLADEACPTSPRTGYKDSGLRKREAWEHTWDLQRREDAGEKVGDDPGAAEVHHRRLPQDVVLAGPRQARRAQGAVHPLPGRRPRDRPHPAARLGRLGPRAAGAGPDAGHRASGRTRAGTTSGWSPWSRGSPSCSPGCSSGTPRLDPTYGVNLADFLEEQLRGRGLTRWA